MGVSLAHTEHTQAEYILFFLKGEAGICFKINSVCYTSFLVCVEVSRCSQGVLPSPEKGVVRLLYHQPCQDVLAAKLR